MRLSQIINFLEEIAPTHYQESYDNSGLLVGQPQMEIKKALICLDSTEEIIDEAIAKGCNLIIAHHPIVFSGIKKLNGKNYIERTVIKAIKNDIAIYAIHTNLDNVYQGVNRKICDQLKLVDCEILRPKAQSLLKLVIFCSVTESDAITKLIKEISKREIKNYPIRDFSTLGVKNYQAERKNDPDYLKSISSFRLETIVPVHLEGKIRHAFQQYALESSIAFDLSPLNNLDPDLGSGMVGMVKSPVSELEFLNFVKKRLETDCIRHTALRRKKIKKVAVCGGAGSFLLQDAIASGADVFITGDFKYHQFFDADGKIIIADVGHYESEQFTKVLLYDLLKQKFPNFALLFSKLNTNPIKYLV